MSCDIIYAQHNTEYILCSKSGHIRTHNSNALEAHSLKITVSPPPPPKHLQYMFMKQYVEFITIFPDICIEL